MINEYIKQAIEQTIGVHLFTDLEKYPEELHQKKIKKVFENNDNL